MEDLLQGLYQAFIEFVQYVFNAIFGEWNYQVLFSWLPADILAAATTIILVLFGYALIRWIASIIP